MLETAFFSGPLLANILIGILTAFLLYWFSIRNHDYWKKKGIPYVEPLPFFGSLLDMMRRPIQEVEMERYNRLGPIYGVYEGSRAVISIGDPVLLRGILIKDFGSFTNRREFVSGDKTMDKMMFALRGEDWKRIRSIVSPTFSTRKMRRMLNIFKDCTQTLGKNFKTYAEEGKPVDARRMYGAFSMDVIASTAFSTKIDSFNDPDNEFVKHAKRLTNQQVGLKVIPLVLFPRLASLLNLKIMDIEAANFFKDITLQIIEERKRTGQVRNDFLQLLLDTAKEVAEEEKWDTADKDKGDITSNYAEQDAGYQLFKITKSKNLSMDELVAQCVIFFFAGYESTANNISFVTYELALHQDVQDKLREEVDEVLSRNNGELTYEAVQGMKYMDNVISETFRFYPGLIRLERQADSDYELGETGITLPKDMVVSIPVYALHRDPKYFPDPETFDPDRFTPETRSKRDPYVYLPFGAGPRNCVAMRFALLEIKVCLSYIVANFKINRCSETKVPLVLGKNQGLLQPKEIMVRMEVRSDSPWKKMLK